MEIERLKFEEIAKWSNYMHKTLLFGIFHILLYTEIMGRIELRLPKPKRVSVVSEIHDPAQLEEDDAILILSGFPISDLPYKMVCNLDDIVNLTSDVAFSTLSDEQSLSIQLPKYKDGPHFVKIFVFSQPSNSLIEMQSTSFEVRTGWNHGELTDKACELCEFTSDWTKDHLSEWNTLLSEFMLPQKMNWTTTQNQSGFDILEIGSWEGR